MLEKRDQWMHDFVLDRDLDWDALRKLLERPFVHQVRDHLTAVSLLFGLSPGALEEAHALARFACEQSGGALHSDSRNWLTFHLPHSRMWTNWRKHTAHLRVLQICS